MNRFIKVLFGMYVITIWGVVYEDKTKKKW